MKINFVFEFFSKNSLTDSGRSIFGYFSFRIWFGPVIRTERNVSVSRTHGRRTTFFTNDLVV